MSLDEIKRKAERLARELYEVCGDPIIAAHIANQFAEMKMIGNISVCAKKRKRQSSFAGFSI